jgi:lipopolysaccharide transport system permease protein
MQLHSSSFLKLFKSTWLNKSLLYRLSTREIAGRYKGSFLGLMWSILNPIFMLLVFAFVFGQIIQAKWGDSRIEGQLDFSVALFTGLLLYFFFSEMIGSAVNIIMSNANYVKKVVFPLEMLPIITLISSLFHLIISFMVLLALMAFSNWEFSYHIIYVPIILIPFLIMVLGLSWFLAALGVYFRDVGQIIPPVLTAMMFLSPIFYPLSNVSEKYLWLYQINPLTIIIEQMRSVILYHNAPDFYQLGIYFFISLVIGKLGFTFFQNTRKGFADVL